MHLSFSIVLVGMQMWVHSSLHVQYSSPVCAGVLQLLLKYTRITEKEVCSGQKVGLWDETKQHRRSLCGTKSKFSGECADASATHFFHVQTDGPYHQREPMRWGGHDGWLHEKSEIPSGSDLIRMTDSHWWNHAGLLTWPAEESKTAQKKAKSEKPRDHMKNRKGQGNNEQWGAAWEISVINRDVELAGDGLR